jgi:hypothetical protein
MVSWELMVLHKCLAGELPADGLPKETAEEGQQEAIGNPKSSCKPKDNLIGVERQALWALKANEELTVLPADNSNVTMVLEC